MQEDECIPSDDELSESEYNVEMASSKMKEGEGYLNDNELTPIDEDTAARYLSYGGPLAKSPKFEEREGQLQLIRHIVRAMNTDSIGVFEAGTGVGKSYAYLIPAILWADTNHERVVISTGTINLQHQLFEKDIPAALRITGKKMKAVLLKGRNNFVCLRRLADAEALFLSKNEDADDEALHQFQKILQWAHSPDTTTGSKSELPFVPLSEVWSRVRSESESCLAGHCPFRPSCFVAKMRREAHDANIIVVNHHLLFADAESRLSGISYDDDAVLPAFHRLIIDEAHDIEEAATSFFSDEVNRYSLGRPISSLYRKQGKREKGYLLAISSASSQEAREKIRDGANAARKAIKELEESAMEVVSSGSMRLYKATEKKLSAVLKKAASTSQAIMTFVSIAKEILSDAKDEEKDVAKATGNKSNSPNAVYKASAYWEAKLLVARLADAAFALSCFPEYDSEDGRKSVFYLDVRGSDNPYITFCRTPLDVSSKISRGIFEPLSSVICTSATLSVAGDMQYWMRRSGASLSEGERLMTAFLPSPFPYKENCLVAVPNDVPLPNEKSFNDYVSVIICSLIKSSGGRALILFTSYDALHKASHEVEKAASALDKQLKGIRVLCQGDDDNARLLAAFKEDTSSVLFATDAFWQGVDVAGESLSLVVIVKLPFIIPDDPVFAARAEAIEVAGGNSFMQMSVPQAVIKFRQGFGRLIRRSDDRGAVVILDRRVIASRYGSIFMKSLPQTRYIEARLEDVLNKVSLFLQNNKQKYPKE